MRILQLLNHRPKDHWSHQTSDHLNGEFVLQEPNVCGARIMIGNYLEVVLHKKLGAWQGKTKRPDGQPTEVRGYELVIHHSAVHGDGPWEKIGPPEMVKFLSSSTMDNMLRDQEEGSQITMRPVLVSKRLGPETQEKNKKLYKWYVIAIDGVYKGPHGGVDFVPHSALLEK